MHYHMSSQLVLAFKHGCATRVLAFDLLLEMHVSMFGQRPLIRVKLTIMANVTFETLVAEGGVITIWIHSALDSDQILSLMHYESLLSSLHFNEGTL